jgi:hypothetical protein
MRARRGTDLTDATGQEALAPVKMNNECSDRKYSMCQLENMILLMLVVRDHKDQLQ